MQSIDIATVVAKLTRAEKVALCSGQSFWQLKAIERLGIPSLFITDGPHGVRKQRGQGINLENTVPATCFPTAVTLASSWDRELLYAVGEAIGAEARAEQVSVVLGPGANIKRSPLGGRNFEYFSEDPYASSQLATAFITGVQSQGVGTSLKHFAANNQEFRRMTIDTHVDERALREIYLASFETAVKDAQPWTVMCAYNGLNGELCSQHQRLLTDILRTEWGFQGVVVSDWGATYQRVPALRAGMDLEMPSSGGAHDVHVLAAITSGELPEAVLDQAVTRILHLINHALPAYHAVVPYDQPAHHRLARRAAAESTVLLKNTADLLPLSATQSVAVIGAFAKQPRYQGAGSSLMHPSQLDTAYAEICTRVAPTAEVLYADGYAPRATEPDPQLVSEAVQVAQRADVVLLFVGLPDIFETEGIDRDHMRMPESHLALISAIAAVHQRVVVVLSNGSPIEMPWHDGVAAIVEGYLGGQAGGSAIVDVLYGDVNPSGKLSETFPFQWHDHPAHRYFPGNQHRVEYRESVYVGYRYYDSAQCPVRFPFGHGLSYTTFAYSDVRLSATAIDQQTELTVTCTITNTGRRAGKEVVQLYVRDHESTLFRPRHELKGFTKVSLEPGASCEVTFTLDRRAFAYYDVTRADWVVESGLFTVEVGASSRDIRLHGEVHVSGVDVPSIPHRAELEPYYAVSGQTDFSAAAFARLLGPVTAMPVPHRGSYTLNTPISDMHTSWLARLLHQQLATQMNKMIPLGEDTPTSIMFRNMLKEMPLRSLLMFAGPALGINRLEMLLDLINGRPGAAIARWWRSRRA